MWDLKGASAEWKTEWTMRVKNKMKYMPEEWCDWSMIKKIKKSRAKLPIKAKA